MARPGGTRRYKAVARIPCMLTDMVNSLSYFLKGYPVLVNGLGYGFKSNRKNGLASRHFSGKACVGSSRFSSA